ncbi:LPXTG-motif cell wall-anchored protein [Gracilibacillus halotolerans]|uniref:LPXTG-motif cell wall-anchored protein n=1 Tax=Gracilibacillus halotolerans TaxID=74386 RepID=A0A841RRP2_9BACI|nr:leucine-rich repeat domain-containing protein [Gracilibacillus halotolerans]MBB6513258.1 LPXTG-motif cell wall-anchored protein [Gracilibacillus halotolerans]
MRRKKFTRFISGFSAIVLVLSLVLMPVQVLAETEQDGDQTQSVNNEEFVTEQANEAADNATEGENEESEESTDSAESEEITADEVEETEADSVETDSTEAETQQVQEEEEIEAAVNEELVEEPEEFLEDSEVTTLAEDENDGSEVQEPELILSEEEVTKDSVTVSWESSGLQDVEEIEVYLNFELVDTVSADTTSYTFEGLTLGEEYTINLLTDNYVFSNYLYSTPYWTNEELVPVSIETKVDVPIQDELLLIRGNEESTEGVEESHYLSSANELVELSLPVGSFEAILYSGSDPSISESITFQVQDGVNYANNPIELQFNLGEMREESEPFEFEIVDVDETSFTIKWSDVTKLLSISLFGTGSDLGDTRDYIEQILLENGVTEYTFTDLTPNILYNIYLEMQYLHDLSDLESVKVKTDGEDADAPEVTFESDNLKQAVSEEVGVHTRNVTEKDIEYLENLTVTDGDIASLKGLELAHNLRLLYLLENKISDLSPIEQLENLEDLSIGFNQVQDLSSLENLTTLSYLNLNNNEVSDLSPISNLTNLITLRIGYNHIENIDILENFNKLQYLDISSNPLSDYSIVGDIPTLTDLTMSDLGITDINFLSNLQQLKSLYLSNNAIDDIQVLSGFDQLNNLSLSSNNISNLSPLEGLTNLQSVNLQSNNITDISPLANLTEIESLNLSNNPIESVSTLGELSNLQSVYLYGIELSNDDNELLERLSENGVFVYHENFIDDRQEVPEEEDEDTDDDGPEEDDPANDDDGSNNNDNGGTEDNDTGSNNGGSENDNTDSNNEGLENDNTGSNNGDSDEDDNVSTDATDGDNETAEDQDSGDSEAAGTSSDTDSDDKDNQLPNTATNTFNLILFGTVILVAGMISLYFTRKTKNS